MVDDIERVLKYFDIIFTLVLIAFEEIGVELCWEGRKYVHVEITVCLLDILLTLVSPYLLLILELLIYSRLLLEVVVIVLEVGWVLFDIRVTLSLRLDVIVGAFSPYPERVVLLLRLSAKALMLRYNSNVLFSLQSCWYLSLRCWLIWMNLLLLALVELLWLLGLVDVWFYLCLGFVFDSLCIVIALDDLSVLSAGLGS